MYSSASVEEQSIVLLPGAGSNEVFFDCPGLFPLVTESAYVFAQVQRKSSADTAVFSVHVGRESGAV